MSARGPGWAVCVLACALAACGGAAQETPTWLRPGLTSAVRPDMGPPQPGDRAPELELAREDGTPFRLSELRGSWVLLHFTASWCPFCDAEVAHLGEVASAYANRNVKVVLVDVEEEHEHWRSYAAAHVTPNVIALWDGSGNGARNFAPPGAQPSFEDRAQAVFDSSLIIDPSGTIRLFLLPNTKQFDPTFQALRGELDRMLSATPVAAAKAQPQASREPASLTPEQVATVDAPRVRAKAGTHADFAVTMKIASGYHTMSNTPSDPLYIATHVVLDATPLVTCAAASYPAAQPFQLLSATISTFHGDVTIHVPCEVAPAAASGSHELTGTLEYQACTASSCLFPVKRPISVLLDVTP